MDDMSNEPLNSVIMPFLNAEQFIQEAIESELGQMYENWALFLVDDGSTDSSVQAALEYAGQYPQEVRYLKHFGYQNLRQRTRVLEQRIQDLDQPAQNSQNSQIQELLKRLGRFRAKVQRSN